MPKARDSYTIQLKRPHLEWGTYRYTNTRDKIYGEAYIHIPLMFARKFKILKGSIFACTSSDGFINFDVKAAGCSKAGDIYAKQFEGNGDLKALGRWFTHCHAEAGDFVEVEFTSPNSVNFSLIKR